MASRQRPPWATDPQLESPTVRNVDRTYAGYAAALARLTIPELLALASQQAAALEDQRRRVISEMLSASPPSSLDQLVVRSTPTELPSRSGKGPDDPPSRSRPPSSFELLSSAGRLGPRLAGALLRATRSR